MNKDLDMTDEAYLQAVHRLRQRIERGVPLAYFDDTTPGDKDTQCTWGLCDGTSEQWPRAKDHLWPDQFEEHGRVAPKYRKEYQQCPFDTRPLPEEGEHRNGCFHTCRFFQKGRKPTRDEAIRVIDSLLMAVAYLGEDLDEKVWKIMPNVVYEVWTDQRGVLHTVMFDSHGRRLSLGTAWGGYKPEQKIERKI